MQSPEPFEGALALNGDTEVWVALLEIKPEQRNVPVRSLNDLLNAIYLLQMTGYATCDLPTSLSGRMVVSTPLPTRFCLRRLDGSLLWRNDRLMQSLQGQARGQPALNGAAPSSHRYRRTVLRAHQIPSIDVGRASLAGVPSVATLPPPYLPEAYLRPASFAIMQDALKSSFISPCCKTRSHFSISLGGQFVIA